MKQLDDSHHDATATRAFELSGAGVALCGRREAGLP